MLYPFDLLLLLANNQQLLKFFSIRCIRNILPYSVKSSLKNSLLKLRIDNQNNIVLHIFVFSQGFANGLEDITVVMTNHIFNIFNENYPMFLPFNHTKQFKKQIPTIIIKSLAITHNTKGLAWETSITTSTRSAGISSSFTAWCHDYPKKYLASLTHK